MNTLFFRTQAEPEEDMWGMCSPFLSVKHCRDFQYIERLLRAKCKTLEESRNFGSGLERKEGRKRNKNQKERTTLESEGLILRSSFVLAM